jgi:hypothetical protein
MVARDMEICAEADLPLAAVEDMAPPGAIQLLKVSLTGLVAFLSVTVAPLTHTTRIESNRNSRKFPLGIRPRATCCWNTNRREI